MHRIAISLLIFSLIELMTSCNIYDSYVYCKRDIVLEFKYFIDNKDKTNVITKFITGGVLYIYDNSTGNLVSKQILSEEELQNGKHLRLRNGNYRFICWGNQSKKTQVVDEKNVSTARIAAPAFFKKEKIRSNDLLYYASSIFNVGAFNQQKRIARNNTGDSLQTEIKKTLIFKSAHKFFRVRVYGLKKEKNIQLEITKLMPEYNFEMQAVAPFSTSYYPVVTDLGTDAHGAYHEFDFSVLQFKKRDCKNIYIKLTNGDDNKIIAPIKSLSELLDKNDFDLENKQEITIDIDFKFSDTGVTFEIKDWGNKQVIPEI